MIILHGVSKGYRERSGEIKWVLRGFNGSFPDGVNVGILAHPGQGKTTLVRLLAGIEIPTEGRIVRKSKVSFPFGFRGHISGRLSLRQNARFASDLYGQDFSVILENVKSITGLSNDGLAFGRLNGEQKVLFSSALFFSLDFAHMVFDEFDGFGTVRIRNRIFQLMDNRGPHQSHVIVTDNVELVRRFCSMVGVLNAGQLVMYPRVDDGIQEFVAISSEERLSEQV